jgi:hypothetical protein
LVSQTLEFIGGKYVCSFSGLGSIGLSLFEQLKKDIILIKSKNFKGFIT